MNSLLFPYNYSENLAINKKLVLLVWQIQLSQRLKDQKNLQSSDMLEMILNLIAFILSVSIQYGSKVINFSRLQITLK